MDTLTTIHRHIAETALRLDDLVHQAGHNTSPSPELLETSLAELTSTLEELRVSEEELRSQREDLDRSREELRAEAERWRELFRTAPDALLVTDLEGTIREASQQAARLLGAREDFLPGKPLVVFVAEEDRQAFRRQLPWVEDMERLTAWELRVMPRGGPPVRVEVSVAAVRDRSGNPTAFHWVIRDVSHRQEERLPAAAEAEADGPRLVQSGQDDAGAAAWRADFLAQVSRKAGPASSSAAEALAGLLRDSVVSALYVGRLHEGDRLPGIREVARATGLNHKVVSRAYRILVAEGVMEVRDRSGVYVARQQWAEGELEGETARWLAGVLTDAWERRIEIPDLPELIRGWTTSVRIRCACVESSPERRSALSRELRDRFGLYPVPVALESLPDDAGELAEVVRDVDMVVTTPFHSGRVRVLARTLGKPLLVASLATEAEGRLTVGAPPLSPDTARSIVTTLVRINLEAGGAPADDRRLA